MSEFRVTRKNVWQYYEQVSDYKIQCWICRQNYICIDCSRFNEHLKKHHEKIVKYEETYGQEWPWICFRYTYNDPPRSKCLFCPKIFKSHFLYLVEHLNQEHFDDVKKYVFHNWMWKYCTKSLDVFEVRCVICFGNYVTYLIHHLHIHAQFTHLKEFRNVQETREIVLSSEIVKKTKLVEITENVWDYYMTNGRLQVKCKFCEYYCIYMQYSSENSILHKHIEEKHILTFEWEKAYDENKNRPSWAYCYIFISDEEKKIHAKCLLCHYLFKFHCAENHLKKHSKDIAAINASDDWIFKYYTQCRDVDKMKCNICYYNIKILVEPNVFNHIIENHSEELQSNISTKKSQKLRQNYKYLRNFQAQCKLCNFQYYYIDTRNFSEHINKKHKQINKYEEERGGKWPFKFFKYINETTLQCCICTVSFAFEERELTDHLNQKHFWKPIHFIDYGWIWKYCTKIGDFEVECGNCITPTKISLDIPLWYFNYHTENKHPNTQQDTPRPLETVRPLDVAGPSGSPTKLKKTG